MGSIDSFRVRKELKIGAKTYVIFSLERLEKSLNCNLNRLPRSLKILLENLLRLEDGYIVNKDDIEKLVQWDPNTSYVDEIAFMPSRVLLQDFTGIPCLVDLATMRDAMAKLKADPQKINPLIPVDLVIDHSIQVDEYGSKSALEKNIALEYERNKERYSFLKWGQNAFSNFRVIPPGKGIIHQVNLEYLARVVFCSDDSGQNAVAYPDTVIGTDSHTTMINGLGILGWGVGGIEAEAAMLGQPISMVIPQVVGFKLTGELRPGVTATDLVLTITQILRKKGVVGKFVEFYGPGVASLTVSDRATIANMAPEYGATVGFFPADSATIDYLRLTGRNNEHIELIQAYLKEQNLLVNYSDTSESNEPEFSTKIELDLSTVDACIAGPKRPQDRIPLRNTKSTFRSGLIDTLRNRGMSLDMGTVADWIYYSKETAKPESLKGISVKINNSEYMLDHGCVAIASITSCTNTSNPSALIAAGLLAKNAVTKGLKTRPWVKTSFAPGSRTVTRYLTDAGLMEPLEQLGFHLVGYGCTTCIGNSGPLPEFMEKAIKENSLIAVAVISGNRNFEGRIHPLIQASYLASPPLVVTYALAGTIDIDLLKDPIGMGIDGEPVYLRDIWPNSEEIKEVINSSINTATFEKEYSNITEGDENWKNLAVKTGAQYEWDINSTYIKPAPYFENFEIEPKPVQNIHGARVLALFGDSITTDHISPAGSFDANTPAGKYLISLGVQSKDFNQYGARRGNHQVMIRGTFANVRLKNMLSPEIEGGYTKIEPSSTPIPIYDAAMQYKDKGIPLIIIAGKEYGSGSSRDWAAKGPALIGVKAILAESFERIHRSNLVEMGILPLQFEEGQNYRNLKLTGFETYDIEGIADELMPRKKVNITATSPNGEKKTFTAICRLDTSNEIDYFKNGGILHYVLRTKLSPEKKKTEQPVTQEQKKASEFPDQQRVEAGVKKYRVLFRGEIADGYEIKKAKENLARFLKTTPTEVERYFSGKPLTLATNLTHSAASSFVAELGKIGILGYFEPVQITSPSHVTSKPKIAPKETAPHTTALLKTKQTFKINTSAGALTAGLMIALPILYVVLVIATASGLIIHIIENMSLFEQYSLFVALLLYFMPVLILLLLMFAMIKPFVARPIAKQTSIPLMKKKEPEFANFIAKLCNITGFTPQFNIELDYSCSVSLKYKGGLIGLLENNLVLTTGIPVLAEMNQGELASLIIAEIGHYKNKLRMHLYFIIRSINGWFKRVAYEEDAMDRKFNILKGTGGPLLEYLVIPLIKLFVWIVRNILKIFVIIADVISKPYTRKVELDGVRTSVSILGFGPFESSTGKAHLISYAFEKGKSQLSIQYEPGGIVLPSNFMQLIHYNYEKITDNEARKIKQTGYDSIPRTTTKSISDHEKLEFARRMTSKPSLNMENINEPSSKLFTNLDESSSIVSLKYYKEVLKLKFDSHSIIPTKQFITKVELYETKKESTPSPTSASKTTDKESEELINFDDNPNPFF